MPHHHNHYNAKEAIGMPEPGIVALRVESHDPEATRGFLDRPDVTLLVSGEPLTEVGPRRARIDLIVEQGRAFTVWVGTAQFGAVLLAVHSVGRFKLLGGSWDFPLLATRRVQEHNDVDTLRTLSAHGVHFDTQHPRGFRVPELVA